MGYITYKNEEELKSTVNALLHGTAARRMCHIHFGSEPLPAWPLINEIISLCRSLLFPGFYSTDDVNDYNLEYRIGLQCEQLKLLLENQILAGLMFNNKDAEQAGEPDLRMRAEQLTMSLIKRLPEIRRVCHTDVEAMYEGDPAAVSYEEVIYCYPAIRAIINYRVAHELLLSGVPIIPRMITEAAHSETGIDIHPAATIGERFAIDHGTGVVIGATAIIGRNVKLYQGVTLGAKSFDLDENGNPVKDVPRHPIIGDDVIIYSNASILGRIHVGKGAVIGGNVWVTQDVPAGAMIVQRK
ncbi:MAG: serine O-acetyltransferase [Muribaculaceae bacterium]